MNRDVHVTTAHLPGRTYPWKKWMFRIFIVAIVIYTIFYPYEIGHFIGSWIDNFITGVTLK